MKPVFIINGFLESGKSEFISYTLAQPYFKTKGRTLLILCEEGEVEYDSSLLKKTATDMVIIENLEDFTPVALAALDKTYRPERIVIEWNGMWDFRQMILPTNWSVEQQITTIDGSSFVMYYSNMRSLLAEMIRKSEMIIFNRCDGLEEQLPSFKRNIKTVNQTADVIFEGSQGEITTIFEDDLPYKLDAPVIELDDNSYGIWYIDMLDNMQRYIGKTISYVGMVMIPKEFPKGYFVPGRLAMTCCAEDMAFLGFACEYKAVTELKERQWVKVTAKIAKEYFADYGEEGPVLKALKVENTSKPKNEVISFQ